MSSVRDAGRFLGGVRSAAAHPGSWELWSQPRRMVVYMLAWELVAAAGAAAAMLLTTAPRALDWERFGVLAVFASVYIQLSRRQEERRRSRTADIHVDLTGIWSCPAVLVLPLHLALLLILLIRVQRWLVARRPLYRFTFSTTGMLVAAVLCRLWLELVGAADWSTTDAALSLRQLLVLAVAGLVYGAAPALLIGGAIAFGTNRRPTLSMMLGSREDNELEGITIALGVVTAVLLTNLPSALMIMVVLSVVGNRIAEVRQLQVDVRTDSKTGLLNMRGWREAADREMARAARAGSRAALLMVDLDHFKVINDTWGHPAGDDVLEAVGRALRAAVRPTDVVGRFGGEEFVLLLPDTNVLEAVAAGDRIRRTITALRVPTTDKRGASISIAGRTTSVGVAVHPEHATGLDDLLQIADAAVYEAKEAGRDRVVLAPPTSRARTPEPPS